MKRFLRCICLMLCLSLLLTIPAFAAETPTTRESNYFVSSSVYLYRVSNRTFEAWFEVTCKRTMDQVGCKELKIQRSTDNENWTTVATYSMNSYSNLIKENNAFHEGYITHVGTSGYYYRAYYKLYAKDDTGSGTWARYSSSIYIS